MVFCNSTSSVRVFMSKSAGDFEKKGQQFAMEISIRGAGMDRLADRAYRLREILDPVIARHIAGLEMDLRDALIIARDEAVEDFGKKPPLLEPEPAHDAEIDRGESALSIDEQISLMHVGMKEAVAHRRGAGTIE